MVKSKSDLVSVGMLSLGCPKTLVDSEVILGMLNPERYRMSKEINDCDIALLNTCSFIQDAKQESIDYILKLLELKKEGRIKALVVLGCLVQRYVKDLEKELKEVDAYLGTGDYQEINRVLDQVVQKKKLSHVGTQPGFLYTAKIGRVPLTPAFTRYIKISEGCDHICAFCTIPNFRGKHRSRGFEDIIEEAKGLVRSGTRELVITGQDTTYYGRDLDKAYLLPELLGALNDVKGLKWIRLLYAYPSLVSSELIQAFSKLDKVCHYLDMPLQHISDPVLQSMRRGITKERTIKLIQQFRQAVPDLAIRTTFIVGYPGEGDKEFGELLDFLEETRFERLGVFMYSQEEESHAATLPNQVPERIKKKRFEQAMALQQDIAKSVNQRMVGKKMSVLLERPSDEDPQVYLGRTYMDAPDVDGLTYVTIPKNTAVKPGEFATVQVTGAREYDLEAQYLKTEIE